MSMSPLCVLIAGGGLGGLCLAQGLRKAGVDVALFERDRTRTDRLQGYRIHIDPDGSRALHACLPPELYDAFVATCGEAGRGFGMYTERLKELIFFDTSTPGADPDPIDSHKSVSRITLRQVLLAGLDDVVRFDAQFERYERTSDGTIVAYFADGETATGDVLVGADGSHSRVRGQMLPHAERIDTGIVGIAGKIAFTPEVRAMLPPKVLLGPAFVTGPKGRAMFVAVQEFRHRPTHAVNGIGGNEGTGLPAGLLFDNTEDYVMWSFSARREQFGADVDSLDGPALQRSVLRLIDGWHPTLRRLVRDGDPSTITVLPIGTSVPLDPWPASNVTLLGDAIHSMTPYRGIGANVALRDAALLCRRLTEAARGERPLVDAIAAYEAEMVGYGFAAVRDSLRAMEQAHAEGALGRVASRAVMRTINVLLPLKRRFVAAMADG